MRWSPPSPAEVTGLGTMRLRERQLGCSAKYLHDTCTPNPSSLAEPSGPHPAHRHVRDHRVRLDPSRSLAVRARRWVRVSAMQGGDPFASQGGPAPFNAAGKAKAKAPVPLLPNPAASDPFSPAKPAVAKPAEAPAPAGGCCTSCCQCCACCLKPMLSAAMQLMLAIASFREKGRADFVAQGLVCGTRRAGPRAT